MSEVTQTRKTYLVSTHLQHMLNFQHKVQDIHVKIHRPKETKEKGVLQRDHLNLTHKIKYSSEADGPSELERR